VWASAGGAQAGAASPPAFKAVRNVAELEAALSASGRPVMLDIYADWCVSCKELERYTFNETRVRDRLSRVQLLRVDVTANSPDDRALLKRYGLFGPPGILFFDGKGQEVPAARVVGYQDAQQFLATLALAGI
jgi:thiol:disulfide interchange protein DsbD